MIAILPSLSVCSFIILESYAASISVYKLVIRTEVMVSSGRQRTRLVREESGGGRKRSYRRFFEAAQKTIFNTRIPAKSFLSVELAA